MLQSQSSQTNQSNPTPSFDYLRDYEVRKRLAKDFRWFCAIYFSHYFYREPASFHESLMNHLGNHDEKFLEIIGFRGSAKSTFGSMALPIWMALEHPDKYQFIIPISDTTTQSKINMSNIKNELDTNWLLKNDYGSIKVKKFKEPNPEPDLESDEDWQAQNVILDNGVRIMSRSRGQKVRGLRHKQSRPKAIIVDDPEDREWIETKENRDKTDKWMRGEVIPARDPQNSRIIVIGNWLHEDALMSRLKKTGMFHVEEYSLIQGDQVTWKALYPTQESMNRERILVGESAWQREYLLRVVPEEGAVIVPSDIHYYDEPYGTIDMTGHGVDLAISKKASADYTADIKGDLRWQEDLAHPTLYILKNPLNRRMNFHETITHFTAQQGSGGTHLFFVEDVAYQKAAIEEMVRNGLSVTPMPSTTDKRSRLIVASNYIKTGVVKFPRTGCEDLLAQLFGFGVETHDDMVDGLSVLIIGMANKGLFRGVKKIEFISEKKEEE